MRDPGSGTPRPRNHPAHPGLSGVLAAGISYPLAAGVGLAANRASDSLTGASAEVLAGPLPQTTTITDSRGSPIAHQFAQDRELVNRRSGGRDDRRGPGIAQR